MTTATERDLAAIAAIEKRIASRRARLMAKEMADYWRQFDLAVEHEYLRGPELARWLDDGGRC